MTQQATKRKKPRFGFVRETIAELKKVVWLSRREAAYLTGLVLIVAASAGLVLGAIDFGLTEIVERLFLGR